MTWRYIQTNGKTTLYSNNKNSLLFRHGSVTKKPSKTNDELSLLSKELAVLHAIAKLPLRLQTGALDELEELTELEERRKEENEDSTPDEDPDVLKKRRMEEDRKREFPDPDDAKMKALQQGYEDSKYSVLSYSVGSLNFQKEKENGDSLMLALGCY